VWRASHERDDDRLDENQRNNETERGGGSNEDPAPVLGRGSPGLVKWQEGSIESIWFGRRLRVAVEMKVEAH
jgi:hypothetical protein